MAHKKQLTTHRNYKDTVFRMLFSDRKNLLSLYNAVSGAHYEDPEMLEIVTLENAIYMGMKNDLASTMLCISWIVIPSFLRDSARSYAN